VNCSPAVRLGVPKTSADFQNISYKGINIWLSDRIRPKNTAAGVLEIECRRCWGFKRLALSGEKSILDSCG